MRRKQTSQKGITSNYEFKEYNGGALYRPQKVKGRPCDVTPEMTTQSLGNIIQTLCMCQ